MRSLFETVYLARHGETEWNRERRRQGQLDSPLTERGRVQAVAVAEALRGHAIGGLFHSPLGRAVETAKIISHQLSLPRIELTDLAEIHHGDMAGLSEAQIDERFPGAFDERARDKYVWTFLNGESYADADARCRSPWRDHSDRRSPAAHRLSRDDRPSSPQAAARVGAEHRPRRTATEQRRQRGERLLQRGRGDHRAMVHDQLRSDAQCGWAR
ncbi:histidine phosphatase family protein [Nocardioides sp.]|uniref:histidine phosphatase family protein n=1 Tax=Nocardioides sp. TaxID=35761 RepID=UPI0019A355AB|nr:histidine phosphatase family protein [Nocardioides sp.]